MQQKHIGQYMQGECLGRLFDYTQYKPDVTGAPVSGQSSNYFKNNTFISGLFFIEDPDFKAEVASRALHYIYQLYPFLNADQVYDESRKWMFYKNSPHSYKNYGILCELTSLEQVNAIQNTQKIRTDSQSFVGLYGLAVPELASYRFLMLIQVTHAVADGSSMGVLANLFNELYGRLHEDPRYAPDVSRPQSAPFVSLACLQDNARLAFRHSSFEKLSQHLAKIDLPHPNLATRQIRWRLKRYSGQKHVLRKYKGHKLTDSLVFYQTVLQIAYGFQKGVYQDGSVIVANYSHRVHELFAPYDIATMIGNNVENRPLAVRLSANMTLDDAMQQLVSQIKNHNSQSVEDRYNDIIQYELTRVNVSRRAYPLTIYSVTLGKYIPKHGAIIQGYIMCPCQDTDDFDLKVLNLVVVGVADGYLFEFDDQHFSDAQQQIIIDEFWRLNNTEFTGSERIVDVVAFPAELLV